MPEVASPLRLGENFADNYSGNERVNTKGCRQSSKRLDLVDTVLFREKGASKYTLVFRLLSGINRALGYSPTEPQSRHDKYNQLYYKQSNTPYR